MAPAYIVQLEEHIFIHDVPGEPRRRPAIGLLEAPTEVLLPEQEIERLPFLEVRDRQGRELVTVIELLSPSNKRAGDDREQYLAKRRELLGGPAHLVEIDLLRGWPPMPQEGRPPCDYSVRPPCDYSVMISRVEKRRVADFWPIRLRDRLPTIPIPLRAPDAAAAVDLQEALHRAYDGPGYEHFIYRGQPEPALSPEDAAWANQYLVP